MQTSVIQTLLCNEKNTTDETVHDVKVKVKHAVLLHGISGVLISLSVAIEPVGGKTTQSMMHGQYDARPTVTFPATGHQRPLAGTNLYCLVNRGTCA